MLPGDVADGGGGDVELGEVIAGRVGSSGGAGGEGGEQGSIQSFMTSVGRWGGCWGGLCQHVVVGRW